MEQNPNKILQLDRRWLFLLMGLVLVAPLVWPLRLPFTTSKMVRDLYQAVEDLPPGATVLVTSDYDPGSAPELYPFSVALYRHLFQKKAKIVVISLWGAGPPLVDEAFAKIKARELGRTYGVDYVNLGFKEGELSVIRGVTKNLRAMFPKDARGAPIDELPVMNGIRDIMDFALVVNISAGYPGVKEWVQQAQSRLNFKMVGATTAVSALDYTPYYQAGQLAGLSSGMRGSAEYEKLLGYPGLASRGLDAQSLGHLLIIVTIVAGNILYFRERRRGKKR